MTLEEIKTYCKNKYKATEEIPFGDVPICYKLNGKIFAQLYPYEYDYKITLTQSCLNARLRVQNVPNVRRRLPKA